MKKKLTQEELSAILGISKSIIVKVEKNTYKNSCKKLLHNLLKLDLDEKSLSFVNSLIEPKPNTKSKNVEYPFNNISPEIIENIIHQTYLLTILEEKDKLIRAQEEKLTYLDLIEKHDVKDIQRLRASKSDMTNTSQIIKLMWKLKDESSKYFSELELMLKMNKYEENKKMKKGLIAVGESLIREGEALIKLSGANTDTINLVQKGATNGIGNTKAKFYGSIIQNVK